MLFKNHRLSIPSTAEFSVPQLKMMITEIESIIERSLAADKWNNLT